MGGVSVSFSIENNNIAKVDKFREVQGLEVGDTVLYYEVVQLKQRHDGENKSIISKKSIKIRVRLVTEIEIPFYN